MRRLSLINAKVGPVFPCQFMLNKIYVVVKTLI